MDSVKVSGIKELIDEEELFEILSNVNISEEELELDDIYVTPKDIKEIKNKVFRNIKINRKRNPTIKRIAVAAAVTVVIMIPLTILSPSVYAKIKETLQFIPGIGVVEKSDDVNERYILSQKIEKQYEQGKITINGLVIDTNNASLVIQGDNLPDIEKVSLQDGNGKKYEMEEFSHGGSNHANWSVLYKYSGKISNSKEYSIVIDNNLNVPVSLDKAEDVISYANLGPTATIDDVSITAIAALEGDNLKVDVLSPENNSKKIVEIAPFTLPVDFEFESKEQENYYYDKSQIYIKNNSGIKYMGFENMNIALLGKEYCFKVGQTPDSEYTLTIPKVILEYDTKTECTIDLPNIGESPLNKIVDLYGFPVNLSVERIDKNAVKIEIDVNYNENLPETLVSFGLDIPDVVLGDISNNSIMKSDMVGSPVDYEFNIDESTKQLKLVLKNPDVEKKGPWNIPIKLN